MANFYKHLSFVLDYPARELEPVTVVEKDSLKVHWVLPPFDKGAGGVTTIMRFVNGLVKSGHVCKIWINKLELHNDNKTKQDYLDLLRESFNTEGVDIDFLPADMNELVGDAIIATDRYTCYPVRAAKNYHKRFYFVQDKEDMFYPTGSESMLTKMTYEFGFVCLCASKWLAEVISAEYGVVSYSWDLAVDHEIYNREPKKKASNEIKRIACYSRYVTPRRCVELAMLAFDLLAKKGISFHVDFYGWDLGELEVDYPYTDHKIVSESELAHLYNQVDLGVVFSSTNYSLVPKEMMACGLPVLEMASDCIKREIPADTIFVTSPDPADIADKIEHILGNDDVRREVSQKALEYVSAISWENSIDIVEESILNEL